MSGAPRHTARVMWRLLETVHAVVYFAPEVRTALADVGLHGFWQGYFAGRAAPLGEASASLVTATFFNFEETMVARAMPSAWAMATPEQVTEARRRGVEAALGNVVPRELLGGVDEAADLAERALQACSVAGRPLFAAHVSLPWPKAPLLRLWHAATLLREHRGDGHIIANVACGLDGLEAHITQVGTGAVPRSSIQPHRGWSDDQWERAAGRLRQSGFIDSDGMLTGLGWTLRTQVEHSTDRLAAAPWEHLGDSAATRLQLRLAPLAAAIEASGLVPFPNPMGLPRSDERPSGPRQQRSPAAGGGPRDAVD